MPGPSSEIEILYNPSLLKFIIDSWMKTETLNGIMELVVVGQSNEIEFEVVYSDEDEEYQFDLLADYHEGDLKFGL